MVLPKPPNHSSPARASPSPNEAGRWAFSPDCLTARSRCRISWETLKSSDILKNWAIRFSRSLMTPYLDAGFLLTLLVKSRGNAIAHQTLSRVTAPFALNLLHQL